MGEHKINLPNGETGTISGPEIDEMSAAMAEILLEFIAETGSHILKFGDKEIQEIDRRIRARGFDPETRKRMLD